MLLRKVLSLSRTTATATRRSLKTCPKTNWQRIRLPFFQSRNFRSSPALFSSGIVQHRDTPQNNASTPFEWSNESLSLIKEVLRKFPSNYKQSACIHLLYIAQEQNHNWLTLSAMNKIAEVLDMPPIRVYEVATFYSMFNRNPVGRYHIQLCGTTPCQLCGSEKLIQALEKHLHIKSGETTSDGMFTLTEVECLGACVNAPMIQINNQHFYEFLTPESIIKLVDDLRAGREVKRNNQNHVFSCEGPQGQTTLLSDVPPITRDIDLLQKQMKDQEIKAKEEAEKRKAEAAAKK